jgi:hypothetical protein
MVGQQAGATHSVHVDHGGHDDVATAAEGEGHGRPLSAASSDKIFGGRVQRPTVVEGAGRPNTAASSDRYRTVLQYGEVIVQYITSIKGEYTVQRI